ACLVAAGCVGPYVHPVPPPEPELAEPCLALPRGCRDHVYVFLVNGFDPTHVANFDGVRDDLDKLGFHKVYFAAMFHAPCILSRTRRLHHDDPQARFVLVGYSLGANTVRTIAQHLRPDGIDIELLAYIGGDTIRNVPEDRPENCHRIVNVTAKGCVWMAGGIVWDGADLDDAENARLPDVGHYQAPPHVHTPQMLARSLLDVAASVPVVVPLEKAPATLEEEGPTPRRVQPEASGQRDEWDFLKPVATLPA